MRVLVLGLRGFPGVEGGVETHAQNLYPRLVKMGCQVEVIVRPRYAPITNRTWKGIELRSLWAPGPGMPGLESLAHSCLAIARAGFCRPDIVHIHAIGPALVAPLGRALGLRIVVTHHGPDYDRQKWGSLAKGILRCGENLGMRFSHRRIAISNEIRKLVLAKYRSDSVVIPNGVDIPELPETTGAIDRFGLARNKYILQVSRLVPEKRQLDAIHGFETAKIPGWKLVLVGALDPPTEYARTVVDMAKKNPNVVLTGFQTGLALRELYANAGLFLLPSSHEGLPIVILEALSYGLQVLASDIPANLEMSLGPDHYYPMGNIAVLAAGLKQLAGQSSNGKRQSEMREWVARHYNWDLIAEKTLDVYKAAIAGN